MCLIQDLLFNKCKKRLLVSEMEDTVTVYYKDSIWQEETDRLCFTDNNENIKPSMEIVQGTRSLIPKPRLHALKCECVNA